MGSSSTGAGAGVGAGGSGPPPGFRRADNPRDLCCGSRNTVYAEAPPPPGLERLVAFFWWLRVEGSEHRITPDGAMDLIVDPGARTPARVVGARQQALRTAPTQAREVFGVRFRPGAGALLLDVRADALTDGAAELGAVLGAAGAAWERRFGDAGPGDGDVLSALGAFVRERAEKARAEPGWWAPAVRRIERASGAIAVGALAADLGVGERQLERVFRERVGVTPKSYARLARFQASLALARGGARWAEVAAAGGFSDQSHLVREYQALSGASPSLLASEWRMSGLSKTGPGALATVRSQGSSREGSRERSSIDDRDRDRDRDRDPGHHGG